TGAPPVAGDQCARRRRRGRPPWPTCRPRSAPLGTCGPPPGTPRWYAACGRPPGRIWPASNRSGAASRPAAARSVQRDQLYGVPARTVPDAALVLDGVSGNVEGVPHPEIDASMRSVAAHLRLLGHSIMAVDPSCGLRLWLGFLVRSTPGLVGWAD